MEMANAQVGNESPDSPKGVTRLQKQVATFDNQYGVKRLITSIFRRDFIARDSFSYDNEGASSSIALDSIENGDSGIKLEVPSIDDLEQHDVTKGLQHTFTRVSRTDLTYNARLFKSLDIAEGCNSINAKRLVTKEGIVDIRYERMPGLTKRFLRDLFHTLMDARWRYNCLLFTLTFLISWIFFGTIWYAIAYFREVTCIDNVDTWTKALLFSIETQTTIGYGGRAVTSLCPEAIILLAIQSIVGMFISSFMLGLMFGKLARPKNRGKSITFSRKAVITIRDGHFCLVFRYADLCRRILLDSNMRMVIIRPRLTEEGEYVPMDMADLELTIDYEQMEYTMRLFPLIPITVIHIINKHSPLYKMSKRNLQGAEFEIIGILEGTVPTTGNLTQALASYRPNEILWGHRFVPIKLAEGADVGINNIDINTIHETYTEDYTPLHSAEEYRRRKKEAGDSDFESSSSSDSD